MAQLVASQKSKSKNISAGVRLSAHGAAGFASPPKIIGIFGARRAMSISARRNKNKSARAAKSNCHVRPMMLWLSAKRRGAAIWLCAARRLSSARLRF
jgi:ribosomal protein L37AE/L43A